MLLFSNIFLMFLLVTFFIFTTPILDFFLKK
nr:MAG TPA: hypothetical protein [Caudoviricetes sp.]